jgi:branched-chain amino acid transport system permease protein
MNGVIILGLASAALYAVAASGLVVTYTTSGIFNFAHGAVAMVSAFVYWQLRSPDAWHLPVPIALFLTLFVFAPGLGFVIERVLMRRLHDATEIIRLVVPIGLLVALIQIASVIWSPDTTRTLPKFFGEQSVHILGVAVYKHQIVMVVVALAVAVGLRILLYQTRTGVAMRAVVDSRGLAALNGVSPDRISGIAWALGCSLAGLAGVLIAPILQLNQTNLTLLVINAYAAAMVGRLRSLPLTALGAAILGIAREFVNHYSARLPFTKGVAMPFWLTVDTIPAIMLFVVLLVVPQDKAQLFTPRKDRSRVPNPGWPLVIGAGIAMIAASAIIPSIVGDNTLAFTGYGVALGIIALSLVPLTGYAGQISLAPLAFAGIGAAVMSRYGSDGNPLVLLLVVAVCMVVGALVALPALRLKGLYLALATFAFALFVEKVVLGKFDGFDQGTAPVGRLHFFGLRTDSQRSGLILLAVVFVLLGFMVTAIRRGPLGRRLQAMKDSPAACATLGLDLTRLKLEVFALSAGIAGLGGALYGGWRGTVGIEQYSLLQGSLPALPLVLLAVVGGIAAVAGALLGGILLAVLPLIGQYHPELNDLMTIAPGLAGIGLAANPDGAIAQTVSQVQGTIAKLRDRGTKRPDTVWRRMKGALLPPVPALVPERLVAGASASPSDIAAIDAEMGLDWGRCDVDPRDA